jgi:hypothetical protein
MAQLLHEGSESSHACLRMVVNMTCAMMAAFPRTDDLYNLVIGALKVSDLRISLFWFEMLCYFMGEGENKVHEVNEYS